MLIPHESDSLPFFSLPFVSLFSNSSFLLLHKGAFRHMEGGFFSLICMSGWEGRKGKDYFFFSFYNSIRHHENR